MVWKRKQLNGCRLYLILDAGVCHYDRLFRVLKEAVVSGVDIVQLRDKLGDAKDILRFSKRAISWLNGRIPFIINDRVDLAHLAGADGVHLGQDDISVTQARKMLGAKALIGVSCQNFRAVVQAYGQGADYVGFGSVYKTLTKPERSPMDQAVLVKAVKYADKHQFPLFAIGGISKDNLHQIAEKGARRIAVCRDILLAQDPRLSVKEIRAVLEA